MARNMMGLGGFPALFSGKTDQAKGRRCMLTSAIFQNTITALTGGIFYSGFLLGHGINLVNIGILTFIPYIATLFGLLSPVLLERFAKRKWILAAGKLTAYIIDILGLTLLPHLVPSTEGRVIGFGVIVFLASAIRNLFAPGYTVWQLNFLPEELRADYFTITPMVTNFISGSVLLISSAITDLLAGSPHQLLIVTLLRYLALALAFMDVFILTRPKEYPYEKGQEKPRIFDALLLPLRHKKFMLTMLVAFAYNFTLHITASVLDTWVLQDVGAGYTFSNAINASFFLFFLLFGGFAKKLIQKYSWFYTFLIILVVHAPSYFLFAFVNHENYLWLMLFVRLFQHFCGVITNAVAANFLYVNLPPTDRTGYIPFYTLTLSAGMLLAMFFGTSFVKWTEGLTVTVFGATLTSVPLLLALTGVVELVVALLVAILMPQIDPTGRSLFKRK